MAKKISLIHRVQKNQKGLRLDVVAAKAFPEFSRNNIQKWIKKGELTLNGSSSKSKQLLRGTELLEIQAERIEVVEDLPEEINLDILFEDEDIMVINKKPGLVVHPGAGNKSGTLVNGIINHNPSQAYLPRAGIVHRLDKETSGLMVIAKNESSYLNLIKQLKKRSIERKYTALVVGEPITGGIIDKPLGRHPKHRTRQAVITGGKEALTKYKILEKINGYSLLEVSIETGRTHQIRVHMAHIGFPLIGDAVYGKKKKFSKGTSERVRNKIMNFKRQALHASSLRLVHPSNKDVILFKKDLPKDMTLLLNILKNVK